MENAYPIDRKKMYAALFVANIFLSLFRYLILPELSNGFHFYISLASLVDFWSIWEFVLFVARLLEKKMPLALHPIKRIIVQILVTYVLSAFIGYSLYRISVNVFEIDLPPLLETVGYLLYFMLSIVLNLIFFGTLYFFNWKNNLTGLANMQREQAIVKYTALSNQFNPHFLFNALTSLNSLIFENQQLASDFLQQLSKVYRYVLQHKERDVVSLRTELEFLNHYILLLKTRFNEGIDFRIDIQDAEKEKEVVPLTLQILIENAIKHNIISSVQPLVISITVDGIFLIVENNMNKKGQVESSNKHGLEHLKAFYQYLSRHFIEVIETEKTFTVKVPLI